MVDSEKLGKAVFSLMGEVGFTSLSREKLLTFISYKLYDEVADIYASTLEYNTPANKKDEFQRLVKAGNKEALMRFASSYISLDEVLKAAINVEKKSLTIKLKDI